MCAEVRLEIITYLMSIMIIMIMALMTVTIVVAYPRNHYIYEYFRCKPTA